jgi:anaerobic selenocysteine-containing dehydrogenase
MRRTGKKGEGKFEHITWDQAIDIIAAKLTEQKQKYGPESLALLSPGRRSYSPYLYRFLQAHGSPNYGHSGICVVQRTFAYNYTLGAVPRPDVAKTKLLVTWGAQPIYSGSSKGSMKRLLDAQAR